MLNVFAIAEVVIKEMYRRKDFYVLFILTTLLTLLLAAVDFFSESRVVRFMQEFCLLLIWISTLVIAIGTAARQLPAEREARTLQPLLAKPITRSEVVLGKFLGCWLALGLCLLCFYGFFACLTASRDHDWRWLHWFQAAGLHWAMLAVVLAFTILGSLLFASPASNATICAVFTAGILLLGRHLNKVAAGFADPTGTILYGIYYVIPHLELFDVRDLVIHEWPLIPWGVWLIAWGYAAVYAALFLLAACAVFHRRPVS